jgi:hypothetical protein
VAERLVFFLVKRFIAFSDACRSSVRIWRKAAGAIVCITSNA